MGHMEEQGKSYISLYKQTNQPHEYCGSNQQTYCRYRLYEQNWRREVSYFSTFAIVFRNIFAITRAIIINSALIFSALIANYIILVRPVYPNE